MVLAAHLIAAARPFTARHARTPDLANRALPLLDSSAHTASCSCRTIADRLTHAPAHLHARRGVPTQATRATVDPYIVEQPINPNQVRPVQRGHVQHIVTQSKPQVVLTVDGNSCITRVDADAHDLVGPLASQRGEVMALALWLMAQHAAVCTGLDPCSQHTEC